MRLSSGKFNPDKGIGRAGEKAPYRAGKAPGKASKGIAKASSPKDSYSPGIQNITILHTNDMHGHAEAFFEKKSDKGKVGGLSYMGAAIQREREKNPDNTLLLDAGDISSGGLVSDHFKSIPMVDAMNYLEYDAMTVGNHEFDVGMDALKDIIDHAHFPVISANIKDLSNDKKPLKTKPYVIKQVGDLKVGILGLTTPEAAAMLSPRDRELIQFTSVAEAAKKNIPKMKKEGADLIIILSHLGKDGDMMLASSVDGIDVIVGGHSHTEMKKPEKIRNTIITQAGSFGKNLGRLDLKIKRVGGKAEIVGVKSKLIPISEKSIKPDPQVSSIIKKYSDQLAPIMNRKVGEAAVDLVQRDYHVYREDSPLVNFVSDAIRKQTGADIAIISPSSLRANIPEGEITVGKLHELFPWENRVSILKMKGSDIKEVLEEALEGPANGIAISGLKVEIDTSQPRGKQILSVCTPDGKEIDPDKIYRVATRDYFANGNLGLDAFTRAEDRKDTREDLREILSREIENEKKVYARKDGRILNHDPGIA